MNKIITAIVVIFAVSFGIWAYPVIKNRYFKPESISPAPQTTKPETELSGAAVESTEPSNKENEYPANKPNEGAFEIVPKNCNNECSGLESAEKQQYCRNICGLEESAAVPRKISDCADLQNLAKDYCLKDSAIAETNISLCEKIADRNVRSACINRISEEIIDKESNSNTL